MFLSRISRKKGVNFAHYGMKLGMVFKGTTKVIFFSAVNDQDRLVSNTAVLLKRLKQYMYIGFTLGLANQVQFSEARSENGWEKRRVLV